MPFANQRFNILAIATNQQLTNVVQQLAEAHKVMQNDLAEMRKYMNENWTMSDTLEVRRLLFYNFSIYYFDLIFVESNFEVRKRFDF